MRFKQSNVALILLGSLLGACGGGNTFPTPALEWQQGRFEKSASFKDRCELPRSGSDASGNAYPDKDGSLVYEKMWLRSWSYESYLWYSEIDDVNPNDFATPQAYFDVLKTQQSGVEDRPKDAFHYYVDTAEFELQSEAGVNVNYGLGLSLYGEGESSLLQVTYVEPNSPASAAELNISRGATIYSINNRAVGTYTGAELAALIEPGVANQSLILELADTELASQVNQATATRTVTLVSAAYYSSPVLQFNSNVAPASSSRVAYMAFNSFISSAQDTLIDRFNEMQANNVTELVLDLRYNGGGLLHLSSQLAYMISGKSSSDTYFQFIYNDKSPSGEILPFVDTKIDYAAGETLAQKLPSLELDRVFIIANEGTCSASEALINGLRGVGVHVHLVGEQTCGKPYGFIPEDNCGTTYFTIQFRGINDVGFGDYANGFAPMGSSGGGYKIPGCPAIDDLSKELGDATEASLSTALSFIDDGKCASGTPPATTTASSGSGSFSKSAAEPLKPSLIGGDKIIDNMIWEPIQ
ncbi:S41 family peptidase [Agaribacterium haliotis]|uniref:S41 family peptidase n=1 Tax=Agaribacterium haliotis TaxID=2013869 RepID=UPI000BB533B0|nr:S41 family peptidase [Agaribacterium haliotis]